LVTLGSNRAQRVLKGLETFRDSLMPSETFLETFLEGMPSKATGEAELLEERI
jgi:hypothetical protein